CAVMATPGLGIIVSMVISREMELTGGPDGISVPALQIFGWKLRGPETWYWIVAAVLVLVILLSLNLMRTAFGRGLRALADSEIAAQTAGLDTAALKARVFVISAVIAAVSGSLLPNAVRVFGPDGAAFHRSVRFDTHGAI